MSADVHQLDLEQERLNDAMYAKQIKDNPFFQKMMLTLRAQNIERLSKIRKGKHYEAQLKDEHDTLQNLARLTNVIEKAIDDGKLTQEKKKRRLINR